jgi:quercetin dioxygenase-like cupin family protein
LRGGAEYVEVSAVGGDEMVLEQGDGVQIEMGSKHVYNN